MKKALPNTKVTVKLRRSRYKEEWYLIIESYPVYKRGSTRASRVVESINRTISTPIWDKSSIARILPDGSFNYKPKRDLNGIIQCRSTIDQEACIYADNVRKLRQHEYDSAILYTDKENEIAAQNERGEQDFIKYFNGIISKRHPNSSNSIIVNWMRVGELLKIYSQGNPIPFKSISVKLLEDIKMFLLRAPMGGNKKGTISQNTASTYFSIVKAGLKQAFIDYTEPFLRTFFVYTEPFSIYTELSLRSSSVYRVLFEGTVYPISHLFYGDSTILTPIQIIEGGEKRGCFSFIERFFAG